MITVIVPVLNEATVLELNLRRLIETQPPHERIIVDGGSTDETPEIAARLGKLIRSPRGRAIQMNRGAKLAQGEVLLFLHADTWLEPGALEAVAQAVAKGYVGGTFSQTIEGSHPLYRWIERAGNWRARFCRLFYGDAGIFVRREVFEQIGGFPEVPVGEEFEFSRRLRRAGRTVLLPVRIHISARRWEQEGIVRRTLKNWWITLLYHLGVPPERLARYYDPSVR
ncbi:MAG: glycosyl transferase [Candidatus Poribacteria bacterium]|nr:MAG: glycosyl transferase [Candidatus Poribacteria bacterium]